MIFDPSPIAFTLPYLNLPVTWYGILFASGLVTGSQLSIANLTKTYPLAPKALIYSFIDSLVIYATVSIIIGARLIEALFYSPHLLDNPWEFIAVWQGGLASHGGILGLLIGFALFYIANKKHPLFTEYRFSALKILDIVGISGALCGVFIRIGNFINQEIVGKISSLPWAVTFMHPREDILATSRHPVQIYEALGYFLIFAVQQQRLGKEKTEGILALDTLTGIFVVRLMAEHFKTPISHLDESSLLTMGQVLSIPFLMISFAARFYLAKKRSTNNSYFSLKD